MEEAFDKACNILWGQIGRGKALVLATCAGNRVTARTVSAVLLDKHIYFITKTGTTKYMQLLQNPAAALCFGMVQLSAKARFLGHPLGDDNAEIAGIHKAAFPEWFEQYSALPDAVLVELTPVTAMTYVEAGVYTGYAIDFGTKTAVEMKNPQ